MLFIGTNFRILIHEICFFKPDFVTVLKNNNPDACAGVVDFRYDRENDICGSFKNYEFFEVYPEYIIL